LTYEAVKANPIVQVALDQIRKEFPVELKSNESDSLVAINGKEEGKTPLRKKLVFDKVNGIWSTNKVEISKLGYRQKLAPGVGQPGHTLPLSLNLGVDSEEVKKGEITANLEKVLFLPIPVYGLEFNEKGPYINPIMELSEIVPSPEACSMGSFGNVLFEPGSLIQTRISPLPDGKRIVLSLPQQKLQATDSLTNVNLKSDFSVNICIKSETPGLGKLTDRQLLHLDPCVDKDGEWVYFAANALNPNRLNIWRKRIDGKSGYVKVTDSLYSIYDREPAISPDGKRLLYVSLKQGMTQPQIWICNPDGLGQTELCSGENPSWSSDGTKMVYIAPDSEGRKQVWVMNEDGSNPVQLTFGNGQNKSPIWAPGDKQIIYCSNRGLNQENRANWDIWVMDAAGQNSTQLTQGGSYDDMPAISPDGNYIYFLSNRGASKKGVPYLQIWRLEWKSNTLQPKTN
jgi:Tol biopolymer transport system component